MEKITKFAKELKIFGLVGIIVLGLFAYKQITGKTRTTKEISKTELIEMIEAKDDFIVYVGTETCSACITYKPIVTRYLNNHSDTTIYYIDLDDAGTSDEVTAFMSDYFNSDTSTPQTFAFIDGEITANKTGTIDYYNLGKFVTEFNEAK